MNNVPTIICVLKSGGPYDPIYVDRLFNSIERNTTRPFDFVCLTDFDAQYFKVKTIPLEHNWTGWWSKIEMFKYTNLVITIDIDILIMDNIDAVLELPFMLDPGEMFMMKTFRTLRTFTTSLMAWNGDFKYIYNEFNFLSVKPREWDQFYVLSKVNEDKIRSVQSHVKGIYSYKWHWEKTKIKDATMLLFHGVPRMHDCTGSIFEEHWR